jgi:antitoxin CptB
MPDSIETRRRRAAWRAAHRGTKELDLLIGGYAQRRLSSMEDPELAEFEEFLAASEPELQSWLLAPEMPLSDRFGRLIAELRRFHGLPAETPAQ